VLLDRPFAVDHHPQLYRYNQQQEQRTDVRTMYFWFVVGVERLSASEAKLTTFAASAEHERKGLIHT
jgi:hypothetical protein